MEKVSALVDGELDPDEATREIAGLKQDDARSQAWDTYHVIRDALRERQAGELSSASSLSSSVSSSSSFAKRLHERLAMEPTVLAPRARAPRTLQTYALSAAASVAAVAAVGWMAMTMLKQDAPNTLAQTPAATVPVASALQQPAAPAVEPVAAAAAPATEHVHEYLLAHQGVSPSTAIQGVTPYIRTVSSAGSELRLR